MTKEKENKLVMSKLNEVCETNHPSDWKGI
jgi:hypothetical protein